MINLKKYNYITGDESSVGFAISKISDFLDSDGQNILLFCKPRSNSAKQTNLRYLMNNKIEFDDICSFENSIKNKSIMFRVDIVICDFWNLSLEEIMDYKKILDNLSFRFIILAKEYHYSTTEDVNDYHIRKESKPNLEFTNNYFITDKISSWTSDLESLSTSYRRNIKIDQIFNKNDDN